MRKGIVLSGGLGTRLYPCTEVISKQLLPVYDKPLIYYPISTLMMAGIRDILVITSPENNQQFQTLLKDGSQWGINISYAVQETPNGIAAALLIAEDFIGKNDFALILGDNIYYGNDIVNRLLVASDDVSMNSLFVYRVADPERFGVLETYKGNPVRIHEKPKNFVSNYAVTGLYFYNNNALGYAKQLKPSARGELEITDLNNALFENKEPMWIEYMNRGIAWIDTGTFESLSDAAIFVGSVQKRTGTMICCPEEIAFRNTWISLEQLLVLADKYSKSDYGSYLRKIANEHQG
jgi:glucose-1-phosphate thymidylyltransferase